MTLLYFRHCLKNNLKFLYRASDSRSLDQTSFLLLSSALKRQANLQRADSVSGVRNNSKEYVVCKFQIQMQIQIQKVNLSTNSNSKNTGKLLKGAPVDFCSEN
jgi:hypothetical protein